MSSLIQGEATEADIRPLAAGAEHGADYLVLRRRVRLAGNDAIALATFDQLYAPMRAQGEGQPDRTILFARGEASGTPCIRAVADGLRWHFGPDWVEWPCAAFTTMLLGGCGEFFPIHAGCVARGGRAVIVCGRSGLGKTTLVSHLAAQGWDLLSDEISPIARDTALVDPYPVRVGLRTGPGRALIRGDDYEVLTTPRDEKHLVDVGALSGRPAPEPAKLAAVVILSRRLDAAVCCG